MIANGGDNLTLDEVLDELAALSQAPDARELRVWIARFPRFQKEIIEFVTDWVALESSGVSTPAQTEVDRLVTATMARVQSHLDAEELAWKSDSEVSTTAECGDLMALTLARWVSQPARATYRVFDGDLRGPLFTVIRGIFIFATPPSLLAFAWISWIYFFPLDNDYTPSSTNAVTPVTYCAPFGAQKAISLQDDSRLELNSGTCVSERISAKLRLVRLQSGEAIFRVAGDPNRPFVVEVGQVSIEVLGTTFDVYTRASGIRVSVFEGRVKVFRSATSRRAVTQLTAMEQLDVPGDTAQPMIRRRITSHDIDRITAWERGSLLFDNQTVVEIFGQFARYQHFQLVLNDPYIAEMRFSGSFRTSDLESFLMLLRVRCIRSEYDKAVRRITLTTEVRKHCLEYSP